MRPWRFDWTSPAQKSATPMLDAQHNAKRAEDSERRVGREVVRANELRASLRKNAASAPRSPRSLARFRDTMKYARTEELSGVLSRWRAISKILNFWVAWIQSKLPRDSALLPLLHRAVELAETAGRVALKWGNDFFEWAKPRIIDLWASLVGEVTRRARLHPSASAFGPSPQRHRDAAKIWRAHHTSRYQARKHRGGAKTWRALHASRSRARRPKTQGS